VKRECSQRITACFNPVTGTQAPAEDFLVVAGSSDLADREPEEQGLGVAGVRVHPYFSYAAGAGAPDDLAALTLAGPLSLAGPLAHAIALAPMDTVVSDGTDLDLSGFGEQNPSTEELNGHLCSLGMSSGASEACGGEADALFLCTSTPAGSLCEGDSGSGLTLPGSPAMLVGVTDTVEVREGEPCRDGAVGGFANITAPEIRDFIESETSLPPRAPRGRGLRISGVPQAGESLTCNPGSWSANPTFTYTFIDSPTGQVLQSGAATVYQLTAADIGRTILCQPQVANAGGTDVVRTGALPAVVADPTIRYGEIKAIAEAREREEAETKAREKAEREPVIGTMTGTPEAAPQELSAAVPGGISLTSTSVAVQGNGIALVKLSCFGSESCHGTLTLTAKIAPKAKGKKKPTRSAPAS
jgi:hypothetical protein